MPSATPETCPPGHVAHEVAPAPSQARALTLAALDVHSTPLNEREKLARLSQQEILDSARRYFQDGGVVVIKTCLRVEVLRYGSTELCQMEDFFGSLLEAQGIDRQLAHYFRGNQAVQHLIELQAGLDSLVAGEQQIAGQVRRAFDLSLQGQINVAELQKLRSISSSAALQVRKELGLAAKAVSLGTLVAEMVAQELGASAASGPIVVVGTGAVAEDVLRKLLAIGLSASLRLYSPTEPKRASELADTVGIAQKDPARAVVIADRDELRSVLGQARVVIAASSAQFQLNPEDFGSNDRKGCLLIDLGNPRNISPELEARTVDDFGTSPAARAAIRTRSADIVAQGVQEFETWQAKAALERPQQRRIGQLVDYAIDTFYRRDRHVFPVSYSWPDERRIHAVAIEGLRGRLASALWQRRSTLPNEPRDAAKFAYQLAQVLYSDASKLETRAGIRRLVSEVGYYFNKIAEIKQEQPKRKLDWHSLPADILKAYDFRLISEKGRMGVEFAPPLNSNLYTLLDYTQIFCFERWVINAPDRSPADRREKVTPWAVITPEYFYNEVSQISSFREPQREKAKYRVMSAEDSDYLSPNPLTPWPLHIVTTAFVLTLLNECVTGIAPQRLIGMGCVKCPDGYLTFNGYAPERPAHQMRFYPKELSEEQASEVDNWQPLFVPVEKVE